ncbi:MAG: NAD(P)/FAD-dependent oxidoreductase [bacterium]
MDKIRITIIGAGIIGLSIAAELSQKYEDILVLEKNDNFGQETSSRNSEVIHAGIYYPTGSLKHTLCIKGSDYLYELCKKESIPYKCLGKIIIATEDSELGNLEALFKRATVNGVIGLELLDQRWIRKLEAHTNAIAGIHSPRTGIVDSHSLMKYFVKKAKSGGVEIVYRSQVNVIRKMDRGFIIGVLDDNYQFMSDCVINSAGLFSDQVAALAGLDIERLGYKLHYCKGDYFAYAKPTPVRMLVYPLPGSHNVGLGVHATLDLGSRLRFGPDAEYSENEINYTVNPDKAESFYNAASKIIPNLERAAIIPDMAGIRPKLQGPQDSFRDFIIKEESEEGVRGLINLIGIESPGLTACVAIAKMVAKMAEPILD